MMTRGDDTNNDGAFNPIDEDVSGVLDSVVGERLPTGSRVALTSPTYATLNNPGSQSHSKYYYGRETFQSPRFW